MPQTATTAATAASDAAAGVDAASSTAPGSALAELRHLDDVRVFGAPVVVAEVDISHASTTRCGIAAGVKGDVVMPIGALTFDPERHTLEIVTVDESKRRRGVASALWQEALKLCPDLRHSEERSPDGTAWADAVGGTVPENAHPLTAREGVAYGAGLMMHLFRLEPSDLIPTTR